MTADVGLDVDFGLRLAVALESNTAALQRQARDRQRLFEDIVYLDDLAFSAGTAAAAYTGAAYSPPADQWGPKAGFWWAVQRVTLAGFGATTDFINLYKSNGGAPFALPNRALFTFQEAVAGGVATWHPGGKGLLLNGRSKASLVVSGTFTGTTLWVNMDAVQVTDDQLPYYLL